MQTSYYTAHNLLFKYYFYCYSLFKCNFSMQNPMPGTWNDSGSKTASFSITTNYSAVI